MNHTIFSLEVAILDSPMVFSEIQINANTSNHAVNASGQNAQLSENQSGAVDESQHEEPHEILSDLSGRHLVANSKSVFDYVQIFYYV